MIGTILWSLAAAAMPAALPSPGALALAKAIRPAAPFYAGGNRPASAIADAVASNLLSVRSVQFGPGCDPELSACREAAHRVAASFAERMVAARQTLTEQALGLAIDMRIPAGEMVEAGRIATTSAGRYLLLAMLDFGNPSAAPKPFVEAVERLESQSHIADWMSEYDGFFDATKSLPRAPELRVVRPPTTPSSPRSEQ